MVDCRLHDWMLVVTWAVCGSEPKRTDRGAASNVHWTVMISVVTGGAEKTTRKAIFFMLPSCGIEAPSAAAFVPG
jgi:hypothetical protein